MTGNIVQIADGIWNIRGSFRIGGVVDVGTHASLVRLGKAILHLHPFHTVHVERMHELFHQARLHGTPRHLDRFPELP